MRLKRIAILCVMMCSFTNAFSQQVEFGGLYSNCGWFDEWRNCYGYSLAYHWNKDMKKRKSFVFSHYMNWTEFDGTHGDNSDGGVYYTRVRPFNQRFALRYMKTWNVFERQNSVFWLGYNIGGEFFHCHDKVFKIAYDYHPDGYVFSGITEYETTYNYPGFLGVGLVFEYELKEFVNKNLSLSFRFNPEFIHMGPVLWFIPIPGYWLNCLISVKYEISKRSDN